MTGWRLGWLLADKPLLKEIVKVQEQTITCVPGFVQRAGVAALTGPVAPVETMVAEFRARREVALQEIGKIPGLEVARPGGAFYVFPRYRGSTPSLDLSERLLKEGRVAVTAGTAWGAAWRSRAAGVAARRAARPVPSGPCPPSSSATARASG